MEKKHYYFNISGILDPEHGFLISLLEIYKRYEDVVNQDIKDIMPFGCFILQPYEKIVELLKIKPGEALDYAIGIIYSFLFGISIAAFTELLITRINPWVGFAFYGATIIRMIYEDYKGSKEIQKIEKAEVQKDVFITKILNLFGSKINNEITDDNNVIEIVIDEQYDNLLVGLIHGILYTEKKKREKKEKEVLIKFRNIPKLKNAEKFSELSKEKQNIYSDIIEEMKKCKDDKSFYDKWSKCLINIERHIKILSKEQINIKC